MFTEIAWLARSASAAGTAQVSGSGSLGYLPGTADGRGWGQRLYFLQCSGNPVSADLLAHPLDVPSAGPWLVLTGFAVTAGTTATGLLTSYAPWLTLALTWVSGGVRTGTLDFSIAGGPGGF